MVYIIRPFLKNKQNTTKQTDRNDGEEESACWAAERSGGMSYKDITVGRTRGVDPVMSSQSSAAHLVLIHYYVVGTQKAV